MAVSAIPSKTQLRSKTFAVTTSAQGTVDINTSNIGMLRTAFVPTAVTTNYSSGNVLIAEWGLYRASNASWTVFFKFPDGTALANQQLTITVYYFLT